jgi:hypothetical protein
MDPAAATALTEVINKITGLSFAGTLLLWGWLNYKKYWTWYSVLEYERIEWAKREVEWAARLKEAKEEAEKYKALTFQLAGLAETAVGIKQRTP